MDYYNTLGLPFDATPDEVRLAYFEAARRLHPDTNPGPGAREQFLVIQQAYEVLRSDRRRAEYDASLPANSREPVAITLSEKHSRMVIPSLEESQLFYVLLEIQCTALLDMKKVPPVNVCMVLDRSTSMRGQRMEMVKENILQLVASLRPNDIFSLVTFSDRADVLIPPTRVSSLGQIQTLIQSLQTSGATEIFRGLQLGVDLLRRSSDSKMSRHLIFMTDGHTYGDEENCIQLAARAAEDGMIISAFGIGSEWNDSFLDNLAAASGGASNFVTSTRQLSTFFDQRLKDFDALYARNLCLEAECHQSVELVSAYRVQPDFLKLDISPRIPLGNLRHAKSIKVLLEFCLPPLDEKTSEIELMHGKISMMVPGMAVNYTRIPIAVQKQVRMAPSLEGAPLAIIEAMSQLSLYNLQEKARKEVAEGKVLEASRHLNHLATHLLARGDRELAHTVLLEAEQVKQNNQYSEDGEKRIKYGTRILMLPAPE